ncbi:MAG: tetratricopeptide repeat protein [Pseudomonadota bacterium]|nr:tetratricopeptide repeat protein [Pseudomonadota bacterium]
MVESDEEQLEVLKNWWKENGQSIVIAIALAFFGIFGLQAWNEKVKNTGENASAIYQQILDLNVQSTKEKDQAIFDLSGKLKEEYGNSIYAVLSSLITAKKHIESNDFELGIQQLRWALSQDHGDSMEDLIRVRLARVLASSNKSDEAFLILENYEPQAAHLSIFEETKGDIFFQVGNLASAREAYQKAIANRRDDQSLALLELKLADIPLQKNLTEYVDQAINEAEDSY